MIDVLDILHELRDLVPYLTEDDQDAARGLIGYYRRKGVLSPRQTRFAVVIARRGRSERLAGQAIAKMRRLVDPDPESDKPADPEVAKRALARMRKTLAQVNDAAGECADPPTHGGKTTAKSTAHEPMSRRLS